MDNISQRQILIQNIINSLSLLGINNQIIDSFLNNIENLYLLKLEILDHFLKDDIRQIQSYFKYLLRKNKITYYNFSIIFDKNFLFILSSIKDNLPININSNLKLKILLNRIIQIISLGFDFDSFKDTMLATFEYLNSI